MNSRQLNDLLALLDAKSLTEAATHRHVTQPAFSRRVRAIEQNLGFEIIDRSKRPGALKPFVVERHEDIRILALALRRLTEDLRSASSTDRFLLIAAMHSISVSELPRVIRNIEEMIPFTTVRLRSGNLDECYAMLMTGQIAIMISYETERQKTRIDDNLVERIVLKKDRLVPAISQERTEEIRSLLRQNHDVPLVTAPQDSFFGKVLADMPFGHGTRFSERAISSLSPAILEMVLCGLGVGWVTESHAAHYFETGQLSSLSNVLPGAEMHMVMMRVRSSRSPFLEAGWEVLKTSLVF
jgi:DNA-binding transcriptional LysR family regulator